MITILLTSIIMAGCNSDNNSAELAKAVQLESQRSQGTIIESVTITGDDVRLRVGESRQLSATGIDSNSETRDVTDELIWSSSDSSIATVNDQGLVTAVASSTVDQGIVIITGNTINDISDDGIISVSDVAVTTIDLKQTLPETGNIYTCIDASIRADVGYEDGYISLNTINNMTFSLDNNTSAKIDTEGNLYTSAAAIEEITVTANIGDISGMLKVTADPINLNTLDILQDDEVTELITVNIGDRVVVNGQASLLSEISTADFIIDNAISWSQEDAGHTGITNDGDNKGTILALKPGITQLIGTCGGKQAIATLEIKGDADLDSIQINEGSDDISLAPLASVELTLTANYTSTPTSLNVTEFSNWSLNGSSLLNAELIDSGKDTAIYKLTSLSNETGVAIISVTYDGITSSVHINIE